MKGNAKLNYAKVGGEPGYGRQDTMPDRNGGPLVTQPGTNSTMAEYLSGIPDPSIRAFVSDLARKKISETHVYLDWVTKAIHHLSNNCTGFLNKLSQHLKTSNKMI